MEKIKELVERHGRKIKDNNVIDLGWQNGWSDNTYRLHRELLSQSVEGSYTRSGVASWQTFKYAIKEGEITYTVTYTLDSGD